MIAIETCNATCFGLSALTETLVSPPDSRRCAHCLLLSTTAALSAAAPSPSHSDARRYLSTAWGSRPAIASAEAACEMGG